MGGQQAADVSLEERIRALEERLAGYEDFISKLTNMDLMTAGWQGDAGLKVKTLTVDTSFTANKLVEETDLAANAVTAEKIKAGEVKTDNIAVGAVTVATLADGAVTDTKLGPLAVTAGKVANDAITSAQIANGSVGVDELANDAVTTLKIKDGNVTSGKIAEAAVSETKLTKALQTKLSGFQPKGLFPKGTEFVRVIFPISLIDDEQAIAIKTGWTDITKTIYVQKSPINIAPIPNTVRKLRFIIQHANGCIKSQGHTIKLRLFYPWHNAPIGLADQRTYELIPQHGNATDGGNWTMFDVDFTLAKGAPKPTPGHWRLQGISESGCAVQVYNVTLLAVDIAK